MEMKYMLQKILSWKGLTAHTDKKNINKVANLKAIK